MIGMPIINIHNMSFEADQNDGQTSMTCTILIALHSLAIVPSIEIASKSYLAVHMTVYEIQKTGHLPVFMNPR